MAAEIINMSRKVLVFLNENPGLLAEREKKHIYLGKVYKALQRDDKVVINLFKSTNLVQQKFSVSKSEAALNMMQRLSNT